MLFLMFNEKYLSVAIMKSCFPDPLFSSLGFLCYIRKLFCKMIGTLFFTVTEAQS